MREAVIDIVSGSVAGMVSTAVGHPFDTLKDVDSTENSVWVRFGYDLGIFMRIFSTTLKRCWIKKKTRMQIYPGRYANSIRFGFQLLLTQTVWTCPVDQEPDCSIDRMFSDSVPRVYFSWKMDLIDFPHVISSFQTKIKPNDSCCVNIIKTEGLGAVMKGVRAPVYAQTFNNAILFGTQRFCDRNINIEVNRWTIGDGAFLQYSKYKSGNHSSEGHFQ